MAEKDLHYFITRIINPELNWIVVSLRSSGRAVHGRDGYINITWRGHTVGDSLASMLEDWRDGLWYRYRENFPSNGREILDEFLDILTYAEAKLPRESDGSRILEALWELAGAMGAYLGLEDYVSEKRSEVMTKAAEIRERDERVRTAVRDSMPSYSGSEKAPPSLFEPPDEGKGGSFPWKAVVGVALVVLLVGVVLAVSRGALPLSTSPNGINVSPTYSPSTPAHVGDSASNGVTSSTPVNTGSSWTSTPSSETQSSCDDAGYSLRCPEVLS
ncbi:protein of unknown function [Thermococcus nautili]|uniref:hypothetical protein n=1 Tax=Thermococcus nautili TaxID=195522 RepID=UPI0025576E5D|nr:hypothetical protein [Thermococcus nautili]CAI1492953.1 protein of unknown function [Thermococcus nautili]